MHFAKLALVSLFCTIGSQALAQDPPPPPPPMDPMTLSCQAVRTIVDSYGSIVLVGANPYDLVRVVKWKSNCNFDQKAIPGVIPTLDTPACPVGFTCHTWGTY
jgi:hypothetical protein